ncbi:MAG: hypothetical protein AAB250_05420 [Bdellovibrionota bacterium]
MKKFGVFITIVFVFATAVFFAKTSTSVAAGDTGSTPTTSTDLVWTTAAEFAAAGPSDLTAAIEAVKGGARTPAAFAGAANQQRIIDEMNKVILAVKTRAQVLPAVAKIIELAKQDTSGQLPAVQLYRAAASIVPDLEGVVYRCREFVESSDWLHMSVLFGLRDFAYNDYLYGQHVKALFDFVTYPSAKAGAPFKSISELQNFVLARVAPKLQAFSNMLRTLEALPAQNFEFQFDRTILVGQGPGLRFLDPSEAKKLFIKPYIYTIHFLTERALGSLYYLTAMELDEMPVVFNRVIRQTTINTFAGDLRIGTPAKGVTPQMAYEIIKKTQGFLGWRKNIVIGTTRIDAQQVLDRAFTAGVNSAYMQHAAYVCGIKYPVARAKGQIIEADIGRECMTFESESPDAYFVANGSSYLFNPNVMTQDFKEKYHMVRDRSRLYVEAKKNVHSAITSDVTGQTIRINIRALFSAAHSQRDFLPTGYSASPAGAQVPGLGVTAWNYDHGKPMTFKDYTFGGFFDSRDVRDSGSLYKTMTTVLYTKAIAPFAIFIRVPSTATFFITPADAIRD